MGNSAREFAADPCSSAKRGNMVMIQFSRTYIWFWNCKLFVAFWCPISKCLFMSIHVNLCQFMQVKLCQGFATDPSSSAKRGNMVMIYSMEVIFWNCKLQRLASFKNIIMIRSSKGIEKYLYYNPNFRKRQLLKNFSQILNFHSIQFFPNCTSCMSNFTLKFNSKKQFIDEFFDASNCEVTPV